MSATPSIRDEQSRATGGGGGSPLTVREQDGSPSVSDVTTIKVTNGTLTDDGGGTVSIDTGGGGGSGTPSDTVTDETTYGISPAAGVSTNYSRGDHTHGSEGHDAHANITGVSANQHHNQSHNHASSGDGTSLSPATLILPAATSPAETIDGSAVWDSDDDVLTIGDGASRKTFGYEGASTPQALGTASAGSGNEMARANHVHAKVTETEINLANNTTNDVSATKHGFAPLLPNDPTKFLDGEGNYSVPSGGTILNANTTPVGNVGGGEDNLITYTVPANTLTVNGQYLHFVAAGIFGASINTKQVRVYFGSQLLLDTGALAITAAGNWRVDAYIVRTGAATQRAIAHFISDEAALNAEATYSDPTETLSGTSVLKCTGTGTADNDIVEKFAIVEKGGGTASGGSGGSGLTIYTASATADNTENPDPTTDSPVDSLSVTFTLTGTSTVLIYGFITKASDHADKYTVYDGGSKVLPVNWVNDGWYDFSTESSGWQASFFAILSLGSGSHTLTVKHNASGSTASVTFKDRYFMAQVVS